MKRQRLLTFIVILALASAACWIGVARAGTVPAAVRVPTPGLVEALQEKGEHLMARDVVPGFIEHKRRAMLPRSGKGTKALTDYDMISIDSDMTFDLAAGRVSAESHATIESVDDGVIEVGFWLEPMDYFSVRLDGQELEYAELYGYILVMLPEPLDEGERITLDFEDEGAPDCSPGFFGMTFCNLDEEITFFAGCPWVPGKLTYTEDDLLDHSEVSFSLTVPGGYVSAGSADLQSVDDNGDGTFTHRYATAMPGGDVNFAVAPFDVFGDESASGVDSLVYTLPGHDTHGQEWADLDADVIDFYEQRYRDYLYPKIDAVQVLPELGGGVAMLSMVFMYEGAFDYDPGRDYFAEGIFAHEIGHQWWGYMVPLREYQAPWLNEGFTEFSAYTFSDTIWGEYYVDYAYEYYGQVIMYTIPLSEELPLSEMDLGRISEHAYFLLTYQKGAYVMRMLRHVLGEEDFYSGMRAYAEGPGTGGSSTDLYQSVMEEAAGQDLDWFFDQWAWGVGWPHYRYGFTREGDDQAGHTTRVTVTQEQDELFDMPVPIVIYVGEEDEQDYMITHVERIHERSHTFVYETDQEANGVRLDPRSLVMSRREPALTGDIDGSGDVDGFDLGYLAFAYNSSITTGSYNWIGEADLNFDSAVDGDDLSLMENNFGREGNDE